MLVYRVEHEKDGLGPYQYSAKRGSESSCFTTMLCDRHNGSLAHPTPLEYGHIMRHWHYCGFDSLNQLCNWFSQEDEILGLGQHGFVCNVYKVPYLLHQSNFQVVFEKEKSTFVLTLPIS